MPLAVGDSFGAFTVLRLLGSGGMGEVYLVEHPRLPRREALKVLSEAVTAGDDEYRQRFDREADLAATLWHPHIVAVHDRGEFDGRLWITMDYVEGIDAAELIGDYPGGVAVALTVEIVSAIADALDYAHGRGLVHRDVKPANIMLSDADPESSSRRILLSDFGIARKIDDTNRLTQTDMTVGSIAYAAPEQLKGASLDGQADQYALAASAFHLLTGRTPFDDPNAAVVIGRHLSSPPPKVSAYRPELAAVDAVIVRGMAKDPAQRYPSCVDFAQALAASVDAGGVTRPATPAAAVLAEQPTQLAIASSSPTRRRRVIIGTAISGLVLIAATAVLVPRFLSSPKEIAPNVADGLLVGAEQASAIIGAPVTAGEVFRTPYDTTPRIASARQCGGAVFPGSILVYDHIGFTTLRQTVLAAPEGGRGQQIVEQSVVLAPSGRTAAQVLDDSEQQWRNCAGKPLKITGPSYTVTLGPVRAERDRIVQDRTISDYPVRDYRCEHTMGVWSNVIAEAVVCNDTDVAGQSQTIVDQILDNARR
ncbi:MAG: serine/threonine-protein kinase PknH/PknJ [Mycobacterium sp.]